MRNMLKKIAGTLLLAAMGAPVYSQLVVDNTPTTTYLVQNVLLGTGVTASGITYSGYPVAHGSFDGTLSNIGFTAGVILATGDIGGAVGPNNNCCLTLGGTTVPSADPDLSAIATSSLNDAAILEFDFVPMSDTLKFRYVFGSEEYPEYVCSMFNDVFGFFLTGPNPAGGTYSSQNIAIIPGSGGLPVAINTVNPGVPGSSSGGGSCTSLAYSSFYFDNEAPPGATVQYDGFTVPLTAIAPVVCGQTYHIKLAIADAGDGAFDSGVFLEAGSFTSQGVTIVPEISYGGANDSTLYEGCGNACVYFIRTTNLANTDTINVTIGGTATNGTDYNTGTIGTPLPSVLIFAPGQDSIQYCIDAVNDASTEGPETILLQIIQTGPCSSTITEATIYIDEHDPLSVSVTDTTFCNSGGTASLFALVTGGVEPYTYTWTGGLPPTQSQSVFVGTTTSYIVTVNDACTGSPTDPTPAVSDTATVAVAIVQPIVLTASEDQLVCPGDIIILGSSITGGASPYTYTWSTVSGIDTVTVNNTANTSTIASFGAVYQVSVIDVCGNTGSDFVEVMVESGCDLNIPNIITPDGTGPLTNEFFFIENLDKFPGSSLKIYNRWGKKIYESADYRNDWSGGGHSAGTYYFVLSVPMSGQSQAKPVASSVNGGSYTQAADDTKKVFAGFFQLGSLK
jgi:hypothetical protein